MIDDNLSSDFTLVTEERSCNKCTRPVSQIETLVDAGDGLALCSDCVLDFYQILQGVGGTYDYIPAKPGLKWTPMELHDHLDQYIIGQDEAKKTLAVAAYQHYKKTESGKDNTTFSKSNVLLIGPTGSGKTALMEHLASFLDVPLVIQDTVQLTTAGYVGEEIEDVLARLYDAADRDLAKAQKGIVCLDEIDKVAFSGGESKTGIHSLGVQRMLLKPLERATISVAPIGSSKTSGARIEFDTRNVLFIGTGAFSGLADVIMERINSDKGSIGFKASPKSSENVKENQDMYLGQVEQDDLVNYGFMPEFMGRFPNLTRTRSLTLDSMKRILTESKNSVLKQTTKLLSLDGVSFNVSDEAVTEIANRALKHKTGARALGGILNEVIKEALYEYPSNYNIVDIYVDFKDNVFKIELLEESNGDMWASKTLEAK